MFFILEQEEWGCRFLRPGNTAAGAGLGEGERSGAQFWTSYLGSVYDSAMEGGQGGGKP